MDKVKELLNKYKWLMAVVAGLLALSVFNPAQGKQATLYTLSNFKSVGMVLPPIFILIGLLDVWVPKETMVKFMGQRSGFVGGLIAVFIGAVGAGPLYVAFPIAALLIKKGARLAYVFLFLGAWTSVKLPIFMFEWASFGATFTLIHVVSSMTVYTLGAFFMEAFLSRETKDMIVERSQAM